MLFYKLVMFPPSNTYKKQSWIIFNVIVNKIMAGYIQQGDDVYGISFSITNESLMSNDDSVCIHV